MRIFGKGFNFSQDGPGNRLVYHLSGCNLRCIWCSNPEGMDGRAGQVLSVQQIVDEAISCVPMFFSGGGVTFTGGEATAQFPALLEALTRLREAGIHTCLETNGTHPQLPSLAREVDYLIMDFKHFDSALHAHYTGLGNETVCRNYEALCAQGRQLHIRIPLIHGINDGDPAAFARYLAHCDTRNVVFEFLAYHEYGKEKWQTDYLVSDGFLPAGTLETFQRVFREYGLDTITT